MSRHSQCLNSGEDVELGDVLGAEAVELVGVVDDIEVEPAALSPATGRRTPLVSHLLDSIADLTWEVSRERASADAGRVRLDDSNRGLDGLRWQAEAGADAANGRRRARHVGISAEVHVEHRGVGTLCNDALRWVCDHLVHVVDGVHEHAVTAAIELLVKLMELVKLGLSVEVADALAGEVPLESVNEVVVLLLEARPISQVAGSQTDPEGFARVGGTNTSSGCTDCRVVSGCLQLLLLCTVSLNLDLRDKVSARRNLQAAAVVHAVVVEL